MRRILIAGCALLAVACTARADLQQALEVTDVTTGWFDAGVVDGKNKLVPSISFRLRNTSRTDISSVALNVIFRYADTSEAHEEVFKQRVTFAEDQTDLLTIRSQTGYTGDPPQSRAEMLQHSMFRDLDATVYVRQTASQWIELKRVRIERQLLTQ